MTKNIKSLLQRFFHAAGYSIRRYDPNAPSLDFFSEQKRLIEGRGNDAIILDVGAHEGETAGVYRSLFPEGMIYSFEPSPESFAVLSERFRGDSLVHSMQAAVADVCGTRKFYSHRANANNSLFKPSAEVGTLVEGEMFAAEREYEVEILTIDSFCMTRGIEKISILKMDIQGGELDALKGARRMLQEGRIDLILSEVCFVHLYEGQPLFHHIASHLENHSYSLYDIYAPIHRRGQILWAEGIFLGPSLRDALRHRATLP